MPILKRSKYEKEQKVTDDPFKELEAIMDIESDQFSVGWRKRRDALEEWKRKWVTEVQNDISVLNSDLFTSDYQDYIKDTLVSKMVEDLTEETEFKTKGKKMTAKMKVIRRKPQK